MNQGVDFDGVIKNAYKYICDQTIHIKVHSISQCCMLSVTTRSTKTDISVNCLPSMVSQQHSRQNIVVMVMGKSILHCAHEHTW